MDYRDDAARARTAGAGTPEAARTTPAGGAPTGGTGAAVIPANDPSYPEYDIHFTGLPGETAHIGGPHTDTLRIAQPDVTIKLELRHADTSEGPNLHIQVTLVP